VLGGNATRAAWDAGYTKGNGPNQGYRLLKRPEIQARIADIQRAIGRGSAADAEAVIGKLEAAYRQAVEAQYFNAAARLVEVQARIAGHLKSRVAAPHSDEKAEK
jgi:phage terminase small subunit